MKANDRIRDCPRFAPCNSELDQRCQLATAEQMLRHDLSGFRLGLFASQEVLPEASVGISFAVRPNDASQVQFEVLVSESNGVPGKPYPGSQPVAEPLGFGALNPRRFRERTQR